jgi:REP element-mobilizing transposase RayT
MFFVHVEQISIQGDHIHILIRTHRRSQFHYFFRVVAGQIAQVFEKEGLLMMTDTPGRPRTKRSLWMYRPFSRVVRGWRAYWIVRDYIQLNEKEALGVIPYRKERLKGLSIGEWNLLWAP